MIGNITSGYPCPNCGKDYPGYIDFWLVESGYTKGMQLRCHWCEHQWKVYRDGTVDEDRWEDNGGPA
jgi:DNA-directed RNA polymerase subunit RPC12/RpoP